MSKVYKTVITACDRIVPTGLRPLWNHEAGPKTVFFWAPAFKWALVLTSIEQFRRPIETVSTTQSGSLALTGFIWTRYCLVIKPINYSLSICNFSLGLANGVQCFRAFSFQRSQGDVGGKVDAEVKDVTEVEEVGSNEATDNDSV